MSPAGADSDITFFQRYECKYLVSRLVVPQIREFMQPFVRPDCHASSPDGLRYSICSLYLDTDDLRFYQQTVGGDKNRFKLRLRTYDDLPGSTVFAEVKRRMNNVVQKRRAQLTRTQARALIAAAGDEWLAELPPDLAADADYFHKHMRLTAAKPVLRVKYMREAYESAGGDPVRITLDTDLMHASTLDDNLSHRDGRWVSTPVSDVILEIKFTERFPSWVHDLVQVFGLKQRSVPKYIMSMDHVLYEGRESVLSMAGILMPPRRA